MDWQEIANSLIGEIGALPALLVIGLGYAYWQERKSREADRKHMQERIDTLQEARLAEMRMTIESSTTNAQAMDRAVAALGGGR